MKRNNPLPKVHKEIKKYVKLAMRSKISDLRRRLKAHESELVEGMYDAVRDEIEHAIEQAYHEGLADGRDLEGSHGN